MRMTVRLFAALLLLLAAAAPAGAQAGAPAHGADAARTVAHEAATRLRSPVTPSHTLDMCPAPAAIALRDTILVAAMGGMTSREIVEDVIGRYGEQVRLIPRRSGFGLFAWLVTPLALIGGGVFLVFRLRAMRGRGPAPLAAGGAPMSAEERAELDLALREFERAEEPA